VSTKYFQRFEQAMKIIQSFVIGKYFMQTVLTLVGWLLWGVLPTGKQATVPHPFHVGVVEINHNAGEATLEVQCKLFTDDFEDALSKVYKRKADLIAPAYHTSMDTLVQHYLKTHLSILVNGKIMLANYLGFEQEREAVYVYLEIEKAPALIEKATVETSLLYDLYDDQVNLIHFSTQNKRKSAKLDYPAKAAQLDF
jgi:hypothetical protein